MIANLFEPHEKRQDHAAPLDALDLRRLDVLGQFRDRLLVKGGLPASQSAKRRQFRFLR